MSRQPLAEHFGERSATLAPDRLRELEVSLRALVAEARDAWPELSTSEEKFVRHLAECVPREKVESGDLSGLHAADLYLACACASGEELALQAFQKRYLGKVKAYLGRMSLSDSVVDDVRQLLSQRLLTSNDGSAPRIATYAGRAALDAWVRIAAIRTALNRIRGDKRHQTLHEERAEILGVSPDPELELIKQRYRAEFEEAFRDSMRSLSPRERNLLRLHFVERLGVSELATIHGVHRNTITRWMASAQQTILAEIRMLLHERLRLSPSEIDSMIHLVRSRLEMTLTSLLASTADRE